MDQSEINQGYVNLNNNNMPPKPDNNLIISIISAVLCQVFGIVALVMALQSDTCYKNGDYEGAVKKAKSAKNFALVGIVLTAVFVVFWILSAIFPFIFLFFAALFSSISN